MPGTRSVLLALGAVLAAALVTMVGLLPASTPARLARASTSSLVAGRALASVSNQPTQARKRAPVRLRLKTQRVLGQSLARGATPERHDRPTVLPAQRDGTRGRRADVHGALPGLTSPRPAQRTPALIAAPPATAPTWTPGGSIAARAPPPS